MTEAKAERRFPESGEWFVHPDAWPTERFGPFLCSSKERHFGTCPFEAHVVVASQAAGFKLRATGGGR
jgi:hypothetical protein